MTTKSSRSEKPSDHRKEWSFAVTDSIARSWRHSGGSPLAEAFHHQAVPQAAVADRQSVLAQQLHYGANDAGASQDHVGAIGLKANDGGSHVPRRRAVPLDLSVNLVGGEHGPLDFVWIVLGHGVA